MKQLAILFLGVIGFTAIAGAQTPSNCTPSALLKKAYRVDIADMALQRIYELKSADTIHITIPQSYQDTILGALAAVCNLNSVAEADSVFLHHCVHRYRHFMPKIAVKLDPAISWIANWRLLTIHTGDGKLDSFIQRYGVYIGRYWYDPKNSESLRDWAYLSSDDHINWKAFGDSLLRFPGFWGYEKDYKIGDGNKIYYSKDSALHLTFVAAWGDCPSGCTEFKEWRYTISEDCAVTLDSTRSYRIRSPYLPNCNLVPLAANPLQKPPLSPKVIFPNPVRTILFVRGADRGAARFSICNAVGRQMLEGTCQSSGIDVSTLPPGIYVLILQHPEGQVPTVVRFVKQ